METEAEFCHVHAIANSFAFGATAGFAYGFSSKDLTGHPHLWRGEWKSKGNISSWTRNKWAARERKPAQDSTHSLLWVVLKIL